jgi:8-oxo-dGTP pyrophosphatase MutT (NUDIX family)
MRAIEFIQENEADHRAALEKTGFWGKQAAGCIFLAMDTGRIGIAHRSAQVQSPNTWGTIGGAIDSGENPKVACAREVKEESGYTGDLRLIPLFVFSHLSGFRYYNYLAIVPKEFEPQTDWETQGFGWFDFDKWPSPLHPGLVTLLSDSESMNTIKKYLPKTLEEGPAEEGLPWNGREKIRKLDKELGTGNLDPNTKNDIMSYTDKSRSLNDFLHRHFHKKVQRPTGAIGQMINSLDKTFAGNKLKKSIKVYTGLPENPLAAWKLYKQDRTKPIKLHLPAYTSTSTDYNVARSFAKTYLKNKQVNAITTRNNKVISGGIKHLLLIHLPKGTPIIGVEDITYHSDEHEIILPRGSEILVHPNPTGVPNTWSTDTTLVWHAELVGHAPVQIK